ncbi:dual adapter for phosphotyrosine and 3-phosphotyrosine and 3-phosphoinositide-like, partial [Clinocottus analis]|uniref:dual adapter for phosphotyrosine and 3-phosphotyrosine and 3-phosphoinositide-like n=1 Tax=Clinocottus analis TaxID=304258 RepID=UPI0035BF21DF
MIHSTFFQSNNKRKAPATTTVLLDAVCYCVLVGQASPLASEPGTLIVLKCPYPWRVEEPSIYESVRVHTAIQTGRTENDLVPNAQSLGTKEGYLVKQGAIVKSWKQRWFILNRYELKYFKDKMCEEPIRTLDLRACSAVQFDYSQDRVNCFCLVFPERTFYLCAKTGVEADEWIRILRWK